VDERIVRTRLDRVVVKPEIQPRIDGLDAPHVRALEEDPEAWGPLAAVERDRKRVLVDGFHRLAAAQNLGLGSVDLRIVDPPDDGDLRRLAFELNARHGRPLTLSDRRTEAARLLRLHPEWSEREIGRRCALAQPTVGKIREDLEASAQIERIETRVGKGGYTYSPRRPGDLPPASLAEAAGTLGARVFSGAERARQRKTTGYLRRLLVALSDQGDLLDDPRAAAEATRLVLGDEDAAALGLELYGLARNVAVVAKLIAELDRT
jgi:hypothetical protein